jgi:hypothetical protein
VVGQFCISASYIGNLPCEDSPHIREYLSFVPAMAIID